MRGTSRREDAAFWVLRLDEIEDGERGEGARFICRFTKDRNSQIEQTALEWRFKTSESGVVEITTSEASNHGRLPAMGCGRFDQRPGYCP